MLKIKIACTALLSLLFILNSYARMHILNYSSVDPVFVRCTNKKIPAVTIMHDYPINLAWKAIEAFIEKRTGSCVFYNNEHIVANASIHISSDYKTATITEFNLYISTVSVTFSPPLGVTGKNIYVKVVDKPKAH